MLFNFIREVEGSSPREGDFQPTYHGIDLEHAQWVRQLRRCINLEVKSSPKMSRSIATNQEIVTSYGRAFSKQRVSEWWPLANEQAPQFASVRALQSSKSLAILVYSSDKSLFSAKCRTVITRCRGWAQSLKACKCMVTVNSCNVLWSNLRCLVSFAPLDSRRLHIQHGSNGGLPRSLKVGRMHIASLGLT